MNLQALWRSRRSVIKKKDTIWDETKRFVNPHEIHVDLSKKLYDLKNDLLNELHNLQED